MVLYRFLFAPVLLVVATFAGVGQRTQPAAPPAARAIAPAPATRPAIAPAPRPAEGRVARAHASR